MPALFLLLFSTVLAIGVGIIILVFRRRAECRRDSAALSSQPESVGASGRPTFLAPNCWLAIRTRSTYAVQVALGLHNPKPCSWIQGLAGEEKLFIAPPVKGWILVMGSGLPEPDADVDVCFRFLLELSRRLGQVQYFSASRVVHSHAWVKADGGRIVRAYAWAGKTLWCQGAMTSTERELGLQCFPYFEGPDSSTFSQPSAAALNVERVALLASRWSIDPSRIDTQFLQMERGIAGEPSWRY
jgi:hypothetical protein